MLWADTLKKSQTLSLAEYMQGVQKGYRVFVGSMKLKLIVRDEEVYCLLLAY